MDKTINRQFLIPILLVALVGVMVNVVVSDNVNALIMGLGALALGSIAFKTPQEELPFVMMLTFMLGSLYRGDIAYKSFYLRFVLLILILVRGLLWSVKFKSKVRFVSLQSLLLLLCGLYGLILSAASVNPELSFQRALSFVFLWGALGWVFWRWIDTYENCEKYTTALIKAMMLIVGVGWVFLMLGLPGMRVGGRLRLILGNPNQLGHFCALFAPLVAWKTMESAKLQWKSWGVLLLIPVSILFSGSRAAMLASFGGVMILFLTCYPKKAMLLGLLACVFLGAMVLYDTSKVRTEPTYFEEKILREKSLQTGSGRFGVWKSAQRLIDKKPFIGYGFGITDHLFLKGYFPELPLEFFGGHVHNSYLEELVNIGWVGALPLFLAIFFTLVTTIPMVILKEKTPEIRFLCASLCVVIVGAISGMFESWFTSVGSVFCFPFWFCVLNIEKMKMFIRNAR